MNIVLHNAELFFIKYDICYFCWDFFCDCVLSSTDNDFDDTDDCVLGSKLFSNDGSIYSNSSYDTDASFIT